MEVSAAWDGSGAGHNGELKYYDTSLATQKEGAFFMDRWVPFADLRNASLLHQHTRSVRRMCSVQHFPAMRRSCREAFIKLGGKGLPQGDVGYEIKAFQCIPLRFFFWDRDEEFEAEGNILFDYSATDFNHVESAVSIADVGIKRLAEIAGLPLRGKISTCIKITAKSEAKLLLAVLTSDNKRFIISFEHSFLQGSALRTDP